MKKGQVRPPWPDVTPIATFESNPGNLGDCRNKSYRQMLADYRRVYGSRYTDYELEQMHKRWKRIAASMK